MNYTKNFYQIKSNQILKFLTGLKPSARVLAITIFPIKIQLRLKTMPKALAKNTLLF